MVGDVHRLHYGPIPLLLRKKAVGDTGPSPLRLLLLGAVSNIFISAPAQQTLLLSH